MAVLSPEAERLLAEHSQKLPLTCVGLHPSAGACAIRTQDPAALFPGARYGAAALAGLLLRVGCWEESHSVAQDIPFAEGSYWHGIVHRMEPDASNAGYWFRRTGKHAIFPELSHRAAKILENNGPRHWRLKEAWDPFLLIDWCAEAGETGGQAEATAIEIQTAEWQLLFDWCIRGTA